MAVDVPLPALPANHLDRVLRYRVRATDRVVGAELFQGGPIALVIRRERIDCCGVQTRKTLAAPLRERPPTKRLEGWMVQPFHHR